MPDPSPWRAGAPTCRLVQGPAINDKAANNPEHVRKTAGPGSPGRWEGRSCSRIAETKGTSSAATSPRFWSGKQLTNTRDSVARELRGIAVHLAHGRPAGYRELPCLPSGERDTRVKRSDICDPLRKRSEAPAGRGWPSPNVVTSSPPWGSAERPRTTPPTLCNAAFQAPKRLCLHSASTCTPGAAATRLVAPPWTAVFRHISRSGPHLRGTAIFQGW